MFARNLARRLALQRPPASRALPLKFAVPPRQLQRTLATQASPSLLEAVAADNRELYTYYDQFLENAGNPEAQRRWARQLIWAVGRNVLSKELVVYPLMKEYLGIQGQRYADEDLEEYGKVKKMLRSIESAPTASSHHTSILKQVMNIIQSHNKSEEKLELPALEDAMPPEDVASAARNFIRTKSLVRPT